MSKLQNILIVIYFLIFSTYLVNSARLETGKSCEDYGGMYVTCSGDAYSSRYSGKCCWMSDEGYTPKGCYAWNGRCYY
jgi:hypothetical protein